MLSKGFSLFELLITLAIFSILLSIAYPSYCSYLQHSYRKEAKIALVQVASRLENYFVEQNSYAGATLTELGETALIAHGKYLLNLAELSDGDYLIEAIPQADQTNDSCGILSLNAAGELKAESNSCF